MGAQLKTALFRAKNSSKVVASYGCVSTWRNYDVAGKTALNMKSVCGGKRKHIPQCSESSHSSERSQNKKRRRENGVERGCARKIKHGCYTKKRVRP